MSRDEIANALKPDRAIILNRICDQFESDWRNGERARIEELLKLGSDSEQAFLLYELLILELFLLQDEGESPRIQDYLDRFPNEQAIVKDAFSKKQVSIPLVQKGPDFYESPTLRIDSSSTPISDNSETPDFKSFGNYELIEEIARGGMGVVYRARHKRLNRLVAVKMILSGRFASPTEVRRFIQEVETAASLDHPNIVPVYEIGEHESQPFYSMKLVQGESLAQHSIKISKDMVSIARIMATVARAIHYAHVRGFLHRDIKPSNIMVDTDGTAYIMDFGLSINMNCNLNLSGSGAIMGTPSYMSPEQATGQKMPLTERIDIYSLGAVLYELMVGRPPFRSQTVLETLIQVMEREPSLPSQIVRGIPDDLEAICMKCLCKSPDERYQSADELACDLEKFAKGENLNLRPKGVLMKIRQWTRRSPDLAARFGGFLLFGTFVQINYYLNTVPNANSRFLVSLITILWGMGAYGFHLMLKREKNVESVRMLWLGSEVVLLTVILGIQNNPQSMGVVIYPLLIAASGLWYRENIVWKITGLSAIAYSALIFNFFMRNEAATLPSSANIVMGSLFITGFVVSQQVKRLWAISSYYEKRATSR